MGAQSFQKLSDDFFRTLEAISGPVMEVPAAHEFFGVGGGVVR